MGRILEVGFVEGERKRVEGALLCAECYGQGFADPYQRVKLRVKLSILG